MSAVTKKKFTPASNAAGMMSGSSTRPRQIGLTPTGDAPSWYRSVRRGHVRAVALVERRGPFGSRLSFRGVLGPALSRRDAEAGFDDRAVMNDAVRPESPPRTETRTWECNAGGRSQGTAGQRTPSRDHWHARMPDPHRRF